MEHLDIILTFIITLFTTLGGAKLIPWMMSYFKEKNKYKQKKGEKLEDYLSNSIIELQKKIDLQEEHITELLKENADLKIQVAILQEKLSHYINRYGLGKSVGKE